jgi:hypothetical protein
VERGFRLVEWLGILYGSDHGYMQFCVLNVSCAVVFILDASRDGITSSEHHDPSNTLEASLHSLLLFDSSRRFKLKG